MCFTTLFTVHAILILKTNSSLDMNDYLLLFLCHSTAGTRKVKKLAKILFTMCLTVANSMCYCCH